jgi:hypothetical protein
MTSTSWARKFATSGTTVRSGPTPLVEEVLAPGPPSDRVAVSGAQTSSSGKQLVGWAAGRCPGRRPWGRRWVAQARGIFVYRVKTLLLLHTPCLSPFACCAGGYSGVAVRSTGVAGDASQSSPSRSLSALSPALSSSPAAPCARHRSAVAQAARLTGHFQLARRRHEQRGGTAGGPCH